MPGAGSLKAANYLYEVAPKDGTALGVIVESAALEQALGNTAVQYDAAKFTYVGRVATTNNIFMQWHTSKVQSIADAKRTETTLAGTGPGSIAETVPRLLNALIGTKFKLISGYPASTEAMLAMERGEVEGAVLILGGGERRQAGVAAREEDQDHPADPAGAASPTCRTRRASPNTATRPRTGRCPRSMPAAARRPLPDRAARHPGRPREDVARRVQRHGQGPGVRRRIKSTNVELDPLPGERCSNWSPARSPCRPPCASAPRSRSGDRWLTKSAFDAPPPPSSDVSNRCCALGVSNLARSGCHLPGATDTPGFQLPATR